MAGAAAQAQDRPASAGFFGTRAKAPDAALTSAPQVLRYGGDGASGAPYLFKDPAAPSRIIGLEVDIMAALGPRLGRLPIFVQASAETIGRGLDAGAYDLAISHASGRQAATETSIPYYTTFGQIVIRRGDPEVQGLEGLKEKTVGTLRASPLEDLLSRTPGLTVEAYATEGEALAELKRGTLDAVVMDFPTAVYYARPDRALQFSGKPVGRIEYGFALQRGANPALIAALNTALYAMTMDGSLRPILDRWALWTPMMAQDTGDKRPMQAQPSAYEHFVEATAPWSVIAEVERYTRFLPQIAQAVLVTLEISLLAMAAAMALGALLAQARVHGGRWLDRVVRTYIDCVRGTPLLIQVLFIYYGLPKLGVQFDPFVAGVVALGLNYAAYEAENYRAGLLAIPRMQMEAAIALNMSGRQALRHVIVPQLVRIVLPGSSNHFVSLIKDSSLLSVISLVELTKTYELISTTYYDYFGTGILVAAVYLIISLPFVRLAKWAERAASRGTQRTVQ